MSDDLKSNNCSIYFECIQPKKCVHYKKPKREPKPCKTCNNYPCNINIYYDYCYSIELWKEYKSMCQHNQGTVGRCYNTIAQMQAITKICKEMGVKFKLEGENK